MKQRLTDEWERLRLGGLRTLARTIARHALAHRHLYEETPVHRSSLRDLAIRPLGERHRAIEVAGITVDSDEIEAWDATASDDLE